ncbi:DUF72 domain-containing protein [Chitinophaga polysaccharea]|uniref:DUF72 domain-containing protein n=1 Tax=Chitinophaga polysaccharea TaxID=1293035 RepID=UPI001455A388|nr:DUF72 domain-containing protein [Chitinophaga polysaccharea]NLR60725.1 DUF72 domain-containing protein [Chitinophaga polysaccharea]
MDFGAEFTNYDVFNSVLPPDPAINKSALSRGTGLGYIYLGFPKWGSKYWIDRLYPRGMRENDFLHEYAKNFNAIEFNASHYRLHSPKQYLTWKRNAANDHFLFCPKFPQQISHYSNLIDTFELTTTFLDGAYHLGENLGPIFLQLSEKFSFRMLANLLGYIATLPKHFQYFVEVRHQEWFSNPVIFGHLTEGLSKFGVGLVITDTPGRRDVLHMALTVPKLFLRFVGQGASDSDYRRIRSWRDRIMQWKSEGLTEAFIFLHMHDEKEGIEFGMEAKRIFGLSK